MKEVQPIRDRDLLDRCYDIARAHDKNKKRGEVCWELLLVAGFQTSLRISDLRRLKVKDVRGQDYVQIKAQKTGKEARIRISAPARREFKRLLAGRNSEEWILQSKQRDSYTRKARPITRQRAYQILNEIAREAGIRDRIGCHTLRKTFGYHYYKKTGDVVSLQRILCHTSSRETLIYIGVVQEDIDKSLEDFDLTRRRRG